MSGCGGAELVASGSAASVPTSLSPRRPSERYASYMF